MSAGPDDLVVCPYDRSHRIRRVRMANHLSRCAKSHPSVKLFTCPYNSTHLYTAANMRNHVIECPNYLPQEGCVLPSVFPPAEEPGPPEIPNETEEDWDAEPPVPTYNPNIHCENKPIIRSLQGAPRAARRAFREKERKRIMDII
ncbi:gametocyte-specific factor 1 homolog [Drosophila simulans]|uniref:GD23063 n=1 Tax=Drosophila simulans TaxID=7240 RepID=B4Q6L6_DROSI|nr:gametocyte-specific factor 1 homolog [Drosophila simulans]EDX03282.1 GD23063 [Drosophila simulans]KMY87406.1 uncharacterized protein Dsimw501_GD23063 [Drosophila simulans]